MDPALWGKHAWYVMHRITMYYPVEPTPINKENIKIFFNTIHKVLPCDTCRDGFKNNLTMHPLTPVQLSSREELIKWLFNLHNQTNQKTGSVRISYTAFKKGISEELGALNSPKYIVAMEYSIRTFIHYIIQAYPNSPTAEDKQNITEFINHLSKVLLLGKMKNGFETKLKNNPLNDDNLKSQKALLLWYKKMYN